MRLTEYNNIEDFLVDNTFQEYCSGENDQCIAYWEKYRIAHPEQEETIAQAKRLFHILSGNKKPLNEQLKAFKEIMAKTELEEVKTPVFRLGRWAKIAAIFIALGGAYLWYSREGVTPEVVDREMSSLVTTYETQKGEKKEFELSDGTKVTLNSASKLEVEQAFNHDDRHVHLVGEAYFEVEKDKEKPFVVHTNDFDIRVLGTSFNIKSYPDELFSEALLVEGLIEMKSKGVNENSIVIKPNQKVTLYKEDKSLIAIDKKLGKPLPKVAVKEIAIQEVDEPTEVEPLTDIAWKENRLEMVDQDFQSLKKVLERWYDIDITLEGDKIQDYRFTATFNQENIEQVLQALQEVKPFKFIRDGKNVTIYEK